MYAHQIRSVSLLSPSSAHTPKVSLLSLLIPTLPLCLQLPRCDAPVSASRYTTSTSRSRTPSSRSEKRKPDVDQPNALSGYQGSEFRASSMFEPPATDGLIRFGLSPNRSSRAPDTPNKMALQSALVSGRQMPGAFEEDWQNDGEMIADDEQMGFYYLGEQLSLRSALEWTDYKDRPSPTYLDLDESSFANSSAVSTIPPNLETKANGIIMKEVADWLDTGSSFRRPDLGTNLCSHPAVETDLAQHRKTSATASAVCDDFRSHRSRQQICRPGQGRLRCQPAGYPHPLHDITASCLQFHATSSPSIAGHALHDTLATADSGTNQLSTLSLPRRSAIACVGAPGESADRGAYLARICYCLE